MKKNLTRLLLTLVAAEVAYLALINLALNLPLTQTLINQHRPEKYAVYWERAWSWYPLRVHATGVSANGQTASQQWQADVTSAAASVSLLPLLEKTVRISGLNAQDVVFHLRPRPKPDKDYAETRAFFPPIRDRDPDSPAVARDARMQKREGDGWKIQVEGIRARGSHELWVFQIHASLDGQIGGSAAYQTKGGPVSVSGGEIDAALASLTLNKDWEASRDGSLRGRFDLAPIIPSEHRGWRALGFLSLDADIDLPVQSLAFLDFYLRGLNGMELDGKGRSRGRLKYARGDVQAGTDLAISADDLALSAAPYKVQGDGRIQVSVDQESADSMSVAILFGALQAVHDADATPLFAGSGLEVVARGPVRVLPDEGRKAGSGKLTLTIPSVVVPDLRLYQRYLPDKWGVALKGGEGSLQGHAEYSPSTLIAELSLLSDNADLAVRDFRFETNLDLGLNLAGGSSREASVDLSGSHLRLTGARLATASGQASKPWETSFSVAKGTLGIPVPEGESGETGFRHLSALVKERGVEALLSTAGGALEATLSVSDLGWVNLLFSNPFDLSVSGAGDIAADMRVREGWLAEGTTLRVQPQGLQVRVLDYLAQGNGAVALAVERGGEQPDMRLDAKLDGARLRRQGEEEAFVEQVSLELSALATNIDLEGGGDVAALDLRIPSARVTDMRVYNQYLPPDALVRVLGGEADLTAEVHLEPETASGFVKLATSGLRSRLDEQEVSGDLTLDIEIRDGVPIDMDFDISGSALTLSKFNVSGRKKSFDAAGWQAEFDLIKARAVWRKPILLDLEAEIRMNDTRPIVAMFANQRGKHGWLEKILTVRDVEGDARLSIDAGRALVPYAMVGSDKIDVGAKALVDAGSREGIFYARFRKLQGILRVKDGEKNFDILGAREKFDAYSPGKTPLQLKGRQPGTKEETPATAGSPSEAPVIDKPREKEVVRGQGAYESFLGD
jgi:hypothetical protein